MRVNRVYLVLMENLDPKETVVIKVLLAGLGEMVRMALEVQRVIVDPQVFLVHNPRLDRLEASQPPQVLCQRGR